MINLKTANLEQRIEITAQGFSVLPPQGERWRYRFLTSYGVSLFTIAKFEKAFESLPSHDKLAALHMFGAIAMSLEGLREFENNIQSFDELKTLVNHLISEHLFSQILEGVLSAEHRFRWLEANVAINSSLGANCVRFDATVEERGSVQAPDFVFLLNLPGNVVCRHPTDPKIGLIWIGFVERYVEGDKPAAHTLMSEYEPFCKACSSCYPTSGIEQWNHQILDARQDSHLKCDQSKTAKLIGLTIPPNVLVRADRVIR